MSIYYFLGTEDTNWHTANNWYDAPMGGTNGNLPTSGDDVVILAEINTSTSTPTVNSMTIDTNGKIAIDVTTATCTVIGGGRLAFGTLLGNVICDTNGIVGNASNLTNGPTITGYLTFANSGSTDSDISYPIDVEGSVYFTNNWSGTASYIGADGDAYYYYGYTGTTSNLNIAGNIYYVDYPTLYFYPYNTSPVDNDWANVLNWYVDTLYTKQSQSLPDNTKNVIIVGDVTLDSSGIGSANNLNTYGSYPYISNVNITIYGVATFSEETYLDSSATITGDALFEDLATNRGGTITGTATFSLSSAASMISNAYAGTYGDIEFQYGKGVNGSSILGIV